MEQTLDASGAYRALQPIEQRINSQGGFLGGLMRRRNGGRSLSEQLTDDASQRTLAGVFHYVGEEERQMMEKVAAKGMEAFYSEASAET